MLRHATRTLSWRDDRTVASDLLVMRPGPTDPVTIDEVP